MPSHPVKFFSSQHTGLSSMAVAAGSLISVLDACLINGFNLQTLTSLAIANNVLTGTKNAHGYVVDQVLIVAGANEAALNTEWRITSVTTNAFTAAATGMANVTGTGTITAKVAPAGWSKPFSGTNLAAYKSVASGAMGCLLRVDDTGANVARVVGYEAMTDINTGTGDFPTAAMMAGGAYWTKTNLATLKWMLIATDKAFYMLVEPRSDMLGCYSLRFFGDFPSERNADTYACALEAHTASELTSLSGLWSEFGRTGFTSGIFHRIYMPRSFNQVGSAIEAVANHSGGQDSGLTASVVPYPSGASNGIVLLPVTVREKVSYTYRCLAWPGIYATPQPKPLNHGDVLRGVGSAGHDYIALQVGMNNNDAGRVFIDMTGPW